MDSNKQSLKALNMSQHVVNILKKEEQRIVSLISRDGRLARMLQQTYDELNRNDQTEVNNQSQLRRSLLKAHRGITNLTKFIVQLKNDQTVIQQLINDVNLLKNKPSIQQKALVDYAHDFTVTDKSLYYLNKRQQAINNQTNTWYKKVLTAIHENTIVFDQSTIFDLAGYIKQCTGKSLQNFIGEAKQSEVNKELAKLLRPSLNNEYKSSKMLSNIKHKLNNVDNKISNSYDHINAVLIVLGIITLSSGFSIASTWVSNCENHPWITIFLTLFNVVIIFWVLLGGNNDDKKI